MLRIVLIQIIINYLRSNKRLIVPQLGAFIVKVPNENILFSEMLRRDDGVLRGLLREAGMSELEVAGAIDRLVFEVRHAIQHNQEYVMTGLGVFRAGANETILFSYDPRCKAVVEQSVPHHKVTTAYEKPKLTISPKMEPEPYVKGLRYGKPERTSDAYTYVSRVPRRKGFDKLLLFAIIAAVIALAAIAYGYIRSSGEEAMDATPTEQTTTDAADSMALFGIENQTTTPQE